MATSKLQAPYTKIFSIGTAPNYYDEGTIDVSVQGRTPVSVGYETNQVGVWIWRLYLNGNTLYYGRRAVNGDLAQNTADFIVQYI